MLTAELSLGVLTCRLGQRYRGSDAALPVLLATGSCVLWYWRSAKAISQFYGYLKTANGMFSYLSSLPRPLGLVPDSLPQAWCRRVRHSCLNIKCNDMRPSPDFNPKRKEDKRSHFLPKFGVLLWHIRVSQDRNSINHDDLHGLVVLRNHDFYLRVLRQDSSGLLNIADEHHDVRPQIRRRNEHDSPGSCWLSNRLWEC